MQKQMRDENSALKITCPRHGLAPAISWNDDDEEGCEACFCEYYSQSYEPIGFEGPESLEDQIVEDGVFYSH